MNAGSKVRGQADGFDLNVLPQLMDIKSSLATPTNTTTFLQFIVCYFIKYKVSTYQVQSTKYKVQSTLYMHVHIYVATSRVIHQ